MRRATQAAIVVLTMSLAWGLRGEHGHERGAAVVGALAGLSLAAVTQDPTWLHAAAFGSITWSVGGALSYGRLITPAFHGSFPALGALFLIGLAWGGLGGLGLALGRTLSTYSRYAYAVLAVGLLILWWLVDRYLWAEVAEPRSIVVRCQMALLLLAGWVAAAVYARVWHRDRLAWRMALACGIGLGVGFLLATQIQGLGPQSGLLLDWWKCAEHAIGLCGGLSLWWVVARTVPSMQPGIPKADPLRPVEVLWLFGVIPGWLMANNLSYWLVQRAAVPRSAGVVAWVVWGVLLTVLVLGYRRRIQRGMFNRLFLGLLWAVTFLAGSKAVIGGHVTPNPFGFGLLAAVITLLTIRAGRTANPREGA